MNYKVYFNVKNKWRVFAVDKFINWFKENIVYVLLGLGAVIAPLLFGFFGLVYTIGIVVFFVSMVGARKRDEKRIVEQEQQNKNMQQQYIAMTDKILKLMQSYSSTYSEEDPRRVWAEFNRMIQMLGIEKKNAVYGIYGDLYCSLCNVFQETYVRNFMVKMLHFYYNIAFSYGLDVAEQNALLYYLRWCFRNDQVWTKIGDGHPGFYNFIFPADDGIGYWNEQCVELLEEGCRVKSAYAMQLLADCYYDYKLVSQRDYNQAFKLYQQAAQLGNVSATYMLGQCYEYARGTKTNYQKAGDCYQYAYNISKWKKCAEALDKLYVASKWDKNRYSPDIFTCNTTGMKKENLANLRDKVAKWERADIDAIDPDLLATALRKMLEEIVNSFVECYENDSLKDSLAEKMKLLSTKGFFAEEIARKANRIRQLGNRGAHNDNGAPITVEELREAISNIKEIVEYYGQY